MKRPMWSILLRGLVTGVPLMSGSATTLAHDPIFGIGPHVVYKSGVETAIKMTQEKTANEKKSEQGLEVVYGMNGDWAAGIEVPYVSKDEAAASSRGLSDILLFTKYRFWRHDTFGAQESSAVLLKVKTNTANEDTMPTLGTGTTDTILGLTYGYESLKWYRWTSLRYRHNGENRKGLRRGGKVLFDLAGGWRPKRPKYLKADTVWLLELNGEYGQRTELKGAGLSNTGGTELFMSPGIFWTLRNFAVKAGVQIPIASALNGAQEKSDYRASLTLEWHL